MIVTWLIWSLWLIWFAVWNVMALRVKRTARSQSASARLLYLILLALTFYLLAAPGVPLPLLNDRFVPFTTWLPWLGPALTLCGDRVHDLGAGPARRQLERQRHAEARPRTRRRWPLSLGPPPDLHRHSRRARWNGARARRMARRPGLSDRGGRALAKAGAGRGSHARAIRRRLRSLRRARAGAHSFRAVSGALTAATAQAKEKPPKGGLSQFDGTIA
jgi:hypothetical protein